MKKSKYINLVLLTVSLAAVAKTSEGRTLNSDESNYLAIENANINISSMDTEKLNYQQPTAKDGNITRGGFGDDKHKGAEQSHSDKTKDE